MEVSFHPAAAEEFKALPVGERSAMQAAVEKLEAYGDSLGFPHTSNIRNADRLRELRPRAGRSPWRAVYRRIGDTLVIAAIGPEANVDPRGFRAAVQHAEGRLAEVGQGESEPGR